MKKRIFAVITLLAMIIFTGCKKDAEPASSDPISTTDDFLTDTADENSFEVNPPFFKVTDENTGAVV